MPPPPPPPGPPRPPPVKMGVPPAKAGSKSSSSSGGGDERGALLASIRAGTNLKKTVTNDRSTPLIAGKQSKASSNGGVYSPHSKSEGMGVNGLFAGGIPTLKKTGLAMKSHTNAPLMPTGNKFGSSSDSPDSSELSASYIPPSPKPSNKSCPPPPPPPANSKPGLSNASRVNHVDVLPRVTSKKMTDHSPTLPPKSTPPLPAKPVFIVKPSMASKPAPPRPPNITKPHFTLQKMSATPNNLSVAGGRPNRSLSVRVNRPSTDLHTPPYNEAPPFFPDKGSAEHGVRQPPPIPGMKSILSKTVGRSGGAAMMRSITKHPSEKPPPPPPPTRSIPASHPPPLPSQPPPPLPSQSQLSLPPSQPPPLPPHKNGPLSMLSSSKPDYSSTPPPPPPVRQSSISNHSLDNIEQKFGDLFRSVYNLPSPVHFNGFSKSYPSRNASKLHSQRRAPPPPPDAPSSLSSGPLMHSPHSAPPPIPHATLHLQVGHKMYTPEASSQC